MHHTGDIFKVTHENSSKCDSAIYSLSLLILMQMKMCSLCTLITTNIQDLVVQVCIYIYCD